MYFLLSYAEICTLSTRKGNFSGKWRLFLLFLFEEFSAVGVFVLMSEPVSVHAVKKQHQQRDQHQPVCHHQTLNGQQHKTHAGDEEHLGGDAVQGGFVEFFALFLGSEHVDGVKEETLFTEGEPAEEKEHCGQNTNADGKGVQIHRDDPPFCITGEFQRLHGITKTDAIQPWNFHCKR